MELEEQNKEILENIKEYMQGSIDRGYHKFIYNDLDWDFKCIDAINAIDDLLNHLTKQEKMIELMAEELAFGVFDFKSKEQVKQYFEKKAEESE